MTATFYVGDAVTVMNTLPEESVDLILTSPPFLALRSYLPQDHPDKALEGGSQATPGEYVDWLLDVVEACARVLAPHGSLCFELGDTYAGGGAVDNRADANGLIRRKPYEDQPAFNRGSGAGSGTTGQGWPLAKSLSLIPESFRWAMVYGHNPHTGRQTEPWRLRNVIRWVRPNPPVGALGDKFRPATSELMVFCKAKDRFFDLDAVREPLAESTRSRGEGSPRTRGKLIDSPTGSHGADFDEQRSNPAGAPPLDWWNIPLLDGEEPTRYGKQERVDTTRHLRADKKLNGREGDNDGYRNSPENPNGAPPLDWWNISYNESTRPREMVGLLIGEDEFIPQDVVDQHYPFAPPPGLQVRAVFADGTQGAPLDWWNIPPGGYVGAHYAVWPPELLVKPIKAMCPEKVCRRCGEASRRMLKSTDGQQPRLAAHIKERRIALGLSADTVNGWFGYSDGVQHWERTDLSGARVPSSEDWLMLKERLGLANEFDEVVRRYSERVLVDTDGRMVDETPRIDGDFQGSGSAGKRDGGITAQWTTLGFTDCGHNDYRPGLVLDPFAGSGTTLAVATGHGRDAIGIDLDERNYELALDRVGPLVLSRAA